MPLKTITEYESEPLIAEPPDASGIQCPECETPNELIWDSPSLVCKEPPMRRLNCPACSFSRVVPYKG